MTRHSSLIRTVAERSLNWLVAAALALLLVIVGAQLLKPDYAVTLSPRDMAPERGHAFVASLPRPPFLYRLRPKAWGKHQASTLILNEDDKQLGPGRSTRATIRSTGGGTFALRRGDLYFSASDNSDPRKNGRVYTITAPLFVQSAFTGLLIATLAALILAICILWDQRRHHPVVALARQILTHPFARSVTTRLRSCVPQDPIVARSVYILVVFAAVLGINWVFLTATEIRPCLNPDSASYLGFSVARSPLYPAIVQLVHHVTGDIRWLIPLQLNAILLSLIALGAAVGRLSESRAWGGAFTLLSFTLTPVLLLSYMVLTEALFTAFIALHFAMAGLFIKTRSWHHAALSGLFLIAVILMRPAGYSLLLALPLLIWLLRGEPWKVLIGVGAPILIGFMAVAAFNYARVGTFSAQSYGGMVIIGHVTYLIEAGDGVHAGPHAEIVEKIAKKIAPIAADLRKQPFPRQLWRQTSEQFNELVWRNSLPTITKELQTQDPNLQGTELMKRTNEVAVAISLAIISAHPWAYARHVLANYYGMWQGLLLDYGSIQGYVKTCFTVMEQIPPSARAQYQRFTDLNYLDDTATARRFELRANFHTFLRYGWEIFLKADDILRPVVFFLSIFYILQSFRAPKDPLILLLSYASFQLNAYFGYMATITAAIERYSVPFTPVLLLILFGTAIVCAPAVARFIGQGTRPSDNARLV